MNVERERDARRERELADRQPRAAGRAALQPRGDLRRLGRPHQRVVERRGGAVEHHAAPAAGADRHRRAARVGLELELGTLDRHRLER
jgi:hypothetical protein